MSRVVRRSAPWLAGGLGVVAGAYGGLVALAWRRYGRMPPAGADEADALLDRLLPVYEVVERHHVAVAAPAPVTLAAAVDVDLYQSVLVRAMFRARELVLGSNPSSAASRGGLLAQVTSLGWRVLAEDPGREIVVGAVTQPWRADVVFRGIPGDEFARFREPGYVKIAWTLRADRVGDARSIFRTETRVATTDEAARTRFRWYWACFSPGIVLIRLVMLGFLKAEAERRARLVA